ncbi:MAG: hypothetical protein H0T78_12095 [Longispora sp.]|nr:hypothetical protein [Longispora sp. (in: high G+C Gram-positive bacteria)]
MSNRPSVGAHLALQNWDEHLSFPPHLVLPEMARLSVSTEIEKVMIIGDIQNWSVAYLTTLPYNEAGMPNDIYWDDSLRFNMDDIREEILGKLSVNDLDTRGRVYVEQRIGEVEVSNYDIDKPEDLPEQ